MAAQAPPASRRQSSTAGATSTAGQRRFSVPAPPAPNVQYTVIVRLPFPRNDFINPPLVDWNVTKERTLWKVLSANSRNSELDWHALAEDLQVPLPFLLQQAAWLYERELSQVRAQMRRVGNAALNPTPPPPPGGSPNPQKAAGRTTSSLSTRSKDSPKIGTPAPGTPRGHPLSRTPSNTTAVSSRFINPASPRIGTERSVRPVQPKQQPPPPKSPTSPSSTASSESSSSSDSDEPPLGHKSQVFTRPNPHRKQDMFEPASDSSGDESPAFVLFKAPLAAEISRQTSNVSDTLRGGLPLRGKQQDSSAASSASDLAGPSKSDKKTLASPLRVRGPGPLSPRRATELASAGKRSPARRGNATGSEGTPSMGSSFSDLDDASVTQSAMEEALMSKMQHGGSTVSSAGTTGDGGSPAGGIVRRMSSIGQAFKGRYM